MANKREYKIVILGEGRVGKTSLLIKFVRDLFDEHQVSTINASFLSKEVVVGSTSVTLNMWDTAGQERYKGLGPIYYRDAKGALLVYDITDRTSMDRVKYWVSQLEQQAGGSTRIIIAGNKCDLERERNISKEEAASYARSIGASHISTSAKSGAGVNELFHEIARLAMEQDDRERTASAQQARRGTRSKGMVLQSTTGKPAKKGCC